MDRPASDDEVEVTPEMIEAGMQEYGGRWLGLRDADDDVAREMLREAFLAMYRSWLRHSGEAQRT